MRLRGSVFSRTSSFKPRCSMVSKESRRKAKRSIIGRAVMSDAAKVASRGTFTST